MNATRKRKSVEANDGTYGGMVLAAFDAQSAAARDPRIDPREGDTVTVGEETREVERVRDGRIYYSWPGKITVRSLYPSGWQAWAAQASRWTTSGET